jgi:2-polyprenyl-6-methoxyphenol hydroxylase-like FAD-dependent oxidoreductase
MIKVLSLFVECLGLMWEKSNAPGMVFLRFFPISILMQEIQELTTSCCIVGGGPAGMILALLLARGGIDVIVLEKHPDFFRDFRGDTIHPSTFEIMSELGLLEKFLKVPHQEITELLGTWNNIHLKLANFKHLKVAKAAIGLMPQWDFLKFVQEQASVYAGFKLMMNSEVTDIITQNGRVTGVKAQTKTGILHVYGDIVIGADGRHATTREKARLTIIDSGAPIDVLWFRLSRQAKDPGQILGRFYRGKLMIMLDRNRYWQCGYIIKKGDFQSIQDKGLPAFRDHLKQITPFIADRVHELKSWDDLKLLSVDIDHLEKWYTRGLLCIGDAAHAMSPIGGVGINLAIQDAVAAANILYQPLRQKKQITTHTLQLVQNRRTFPTRITQQLQVKIQNGIFQRKLSAEKYEKPPLLMRVLNRFSWLRRIPARLIGIGFRPEHVKTPEVR